MLNRRFLPFAAVALLAGLAVLFFAGQCWKSRIDFCMSPNEGWNAWFAEQALGGGRLYPGSEQLLTNNYPPLSFYLTGLAGKLTGDDIAAGRMLSLAAVLAIALGIARLVALFGGGPAACIASSAMFLATICKEYDYAGQNDPQLLAQALMTWATLWFLRRETCGRDPLPALLLMVAAGFFKHNIISLPAASLAWVASGQPRRGLRLTLLGLIAAAAGLLLCAAVYGPDFIRNFCTPRGFSLARGLDSVPDLACHAGLPLLFFLPVVILLRKDPWIRFTALLAGISLAAFYLESSGDGVGPNAEFDVLIAASLALGLLIARMDRFLVPGSRGAHAALALVVALVALRLLPSGDEFAGRMLFDRQRLSADIRLTEDEMRRAEALCRSMPGDVYCDPTVLYRAGKPYVVDSYNTAERINRGCLPEDAVDRLYRDGKLSFVENPYDFIDKSWYAY